MIDHRWWCAFEEKSRKNVVMSKSSSNVFEARERVEEEIVKNLLEKCEKKKKRANRKRLAREKRVMSHKKNSSLLS